jgi:hypothetical protein
MRARSAVSAGDSGGASGFGFGNGANEMTGSSPAEADA